MLLRASLCHRAPRQLYLLSPCLRVGRARMQAAGDEAKSGEREASSAAGLRPRDRLRTIEERQYSAAPVRPRRRGRDDQPPARGALPERSRSLAQWRGGGNPHCAPSSSNIRSARDTIGTLLSSPEGRRTIASSRPALVVVRSVVSAIAAGRMVHCRLDSGLETEKPIFGP